MRQLLGLVMSLTASCIGDEDDRKQEVVVSVQKLPESSPSSRNQRTATKQDAVHVKKDARLMKTDKKRKTGPIDRPVREREIVATVMQVIRGRKQPLINKNNTYRH